MPLGFEDVTAQDISGDPPPTRPLTQAQMQGAIKARVNQKQQPAGGPPGGGRAGGMGARQNPAGADKQPSEEPVSKSGQSQEQIQSELPKTTGGDKGLGAATQQLVSGLGEVLNDPEWMQHPLLRLFADPTSDPSQMGQDLWSATQWWGRVINAGIDPNAIHASYANIAHDESVQGRIKQAMFGVSPHTPDWALQAIPWGLAAISEWEPWMWGPAVAAGGPSQANQVPTALMSLFGNDLSHPQFADPDWYARMGAYAVAAVVATKTGGKGIEPLMKFSGRFKALEPFVAHAERLLGGPGKKTPTRMAGPNGIVYDPNADPTGHAFANWYNDNLEALQASSTEIGQAAEKPQFALISHPEIDNAYQKVSLDPTAKRDFANLLGFDPTASPETLKEQFFAAVERRAIGAQLSAKILKNWSRFGPAIGYLGKVKYWHPGEAPYRNVLDSLEQITEPERKDAASEAMRAANGLRADIWKGIHGYGNDLSEALVKGVLNHGRSGDHFVQKLGGALLKVLPTAAERSRITEAIEEPNRLLAEHNQELSRQYRLLRSGNAAEQLNAQTRINELEEQDLDALPNGKYDALNPHEKWAVDLMRRLTAELRAAKYAHGRQSDAQPNFVYRVPERVPTLEKILKGVPDEVLAKVTRARKHTPFGFVSKQHRAAQFAMSPEGELQMESAYGTTAEANVQRGLWREQIKADLARMAASDPELAKVIADPAKLDALALKEIPNLSTDILDSFLGVGDRGLVPDMRALFSHQVLQMAENTLVKHTDGRFHPLVVASSDSGQESSRTLSEHFKQLHDAETTTNYYSGEGWQGVTGLPKGFLMHPSFAEPLNQALAHGKGDGDKAMRFLLRTSGVGKGLIMLNPLWHSTNMAGRFGWLAFAHPVALSRALLKARGMRELNPAQAQEWWQAQEYEAFEHGLLPPQLNEDVVSSAGSYHMHATGDVETGLPMDHKTPVQGFSAGAADALNAVKGAHHWWQSNVNGYMWNQIHNFGVLAYVALKDDAVHRGMSPGDARLMAASQANAWAGMVSPDRWANSPAMHNLSQLLLFAPNWWRTFPRLILNSYDQMGLKSSPALTHAWALNTAKTIGTMILFKGATDNALNWLLSGHWQWQNPDGYRNQVTLDRFFPVDDKTGAHHVMENPLERQVTDLEKALGIDQAMKYGYWKPEFGLEGAEDVIGARASPLLQALETALNMDLYDSVKQHAWRQVDPTSYMPTWQSLLAGAANLTPVGYGAQQAVSGMTAAPQQLNWGPFAGTEVPGWASRAFDPNDPLVSILSLLGVRGGYPAPIRSPERGLSTAEQVELAKIQNDYTTRLGEKQKQVMSGGATWSDFAYWYRQNAAAYANQVQGKVGNTSEYMQGADGLLARYEAVYNDPQAFDSNGDVNWAYIQRTQDQLQSSTDPATWRQMEALRDKRALQYPVLRAYRDSLQNYHNWQDSEAKAMGIDGEQLRNLISQGASAANFQRFEAENPQLHQYYADKRQWELNTKQGFAYGMFTNNSYVMNVVSAAAGSSDPQAISREEGLALPQIEQMEQAGTFVTPSGSS